MQLTLTDKPIKATDLRIFKASKQAKKDEFFPKIKEELYLIVNPECPSYLVLTQKEFDLFNNIDGKTQVKEIIDKNKELKEKLEEMNKFEIIYKNKKTLKKQEKILKKWLDDELKKENTTKGKYDFGRMYIETTNKCNTNCTFCFLEKSKSEIPLKKMKELIKFAKKEKTAIQLSGGEFLLRKDWKEIFDYSIKCKIPFSIITNGILVTEDTINFLKKYKENKKWSIRISFDSLKKETYEKYRGKHFIEVKNAINNLIDAGMADKISIYSVITKNNIKEIPNLIKFIKKNKIDSIHLTKLFDPETEFDYDKNKITDNEFEKYAKKYSQHKKELTITFPGYNAPQLPLNKDFDDFERDKKMVIHSECSIGDTPTIDAYGNIYACPYTGKTNLVGNISENFETTFKNNKNTRKLRKISGKKWGKPPECKKCTWKFSCFGICIAKHYKNNKFDWRLSKEEKEKCKISEKGFIREIFKDYLEK